MKSRYQKTGISVGILCILIGVGIFVLHKKQVDTSTRFVEPSEFSIVDNQKDLILQEEVTLTPEQDERYTQEIEKFTELINNADPAEEEVEAYYGNIALYERYMGAYESSYDSYLSALTIEPKNRILWVGLSETLIAMKAYKSAEIALKNGIELVPGATDTYDKLARLYSAYLYPNDLEKAKEVYEEPLGFIIGSLPLRIQYANWLGEYGFREQALEQYEKLIEADPSEEANYRLKMDRL